MERFRVRATAVLMAVACLGPASRALAQHPTPAPMPPATPTREFAIRGDFPYLGGQKIDDLWGLRCANALYSEAVTERTVNSLDVMVGHGINLIGVYLQGPNAGWPNVDAGIEGFRRDGRLKPVVSARLERLIRAADARGMVVHLGVISPRKDQTFYDEAAIRRAVEETGRFLMNRQLKNVFVDLVHEFDHPDRIDHEILREPDGAAKKAKLSGWFKAVAPDVEVGVCPMFPSDTADVYPGMEVRIIQKASPIPSGGFVVNVETPRQDAFENDGVFTEAAITTILADCRRYLDDPRAVMMFHSAYVQGVTNKSGTAPHSEPGGRGTGPEDRGIRFYFEWVRDHVGRYEYPRHILPPIKAEQTPASAGRSPR